MEKIDITDSLAVEVFDSDDYINNLQTIYDDLKQIFESQQNAKIRDFVDDLNSNIFLESKKVFIYVLKAGSDAVSFAILSKISNASIKLDTICTHIDFEKLGFATILVRVLATHLKKSNITSIVADFEEENFAYQNLLFSFSKVENIKTTEGKNHYKFDIKDIDVDKILEDVKSYVIWFVKKYLNLSTLKKQWKYFRLHTNYF